MLLPCSTRNVQSDRSRNICLEMKKKKQIIVIISVNLALSILCLCFMIGYKSATTTDGYYFKKLDDGSYMVERINPHKTGSKLTVPSRYKGKKVTVIGEFAIPHQATGVELIEEIIIPDSVSKISESAFTHLPNIKNITLGVNIETIEEFAFEGSYIGSITLSRDNPYFDFVDGCLCQEGRVIIGTDNATVPEGMIRICDCAFSEQKIKRVVLPSSCREIGPGAFSGCSYLEEVVLPDGVHSIDRLAFIGCTSLKKIVLPDSIKTIGKYCFYNTGINEIVIPGSVKEIPCEAFACCFYLKKIILLPGVEYVDYMAFIRCLRLEWLQIPASVNYIGQDAFTATEGLVVSYDGESIPEEWDPDWMDFVGYWRDDPNESIEVESVKIIFNSKTELIHPD